MGWGPSVVGCIGIGIGLLVASQANAGPAASDGPRQAELTQIVLAVQPSELQTTLESLVGFGTRHTLSDTTSSTRGIGAARRWVRGRLEQLARECGGCLTVVTPERIVKGSRAPSGVLIQDVLGIQRGTSDADRVVIIAGHLDSRVTDPMNATDDAPGANDDGSGVAAVLEAARVLSHYRFPATIVYAVLSGEEQGLYGGYLLADYAREHAWQVEADLNNDIVGNTHAADGRYEGGYVRLFSEGTKSVESHDEAADRRYHGGEVDSPSRNLARFTAGLADRYLAPFRARMVYRTDRFGRGGDQVPLLASGFPAIRVTEALENYDRQHQDLRMEQGRRFGDELDGVDMGYLAQVTRLDAITLAALAMAPAPPSRVEIAGAVSANTTLRWNAVPGASSYRVWWRDTTSPDWEFSREAGAATTLTLKGVVIDDWFFGVQAVSKAGWESPVVYPGAAGDFVSIHPPATPEE